MSTGAPKRRATQAADKPVKRTRVSRACDQCRLAREKCNGLQPTCSTCSTSRRACTYTANVKKRGIQPGYIRALELALAYLFQHDPENEALVHDQLAQKGSSSLLLSRDSKESNKLHRRWRKARFYTDVDKLLSGGEPSRHDQSEPVSSDSDDESAAEDSSFAAALVSTNTQSPLQAQNQSTSIQDPGQPHSTSCPSQTGLQERVVLPSDSWRLLEVYFTYSQAWLPICSKQDALRTLYSYPTGGIVLSSKSSGSAHHAELFSILAVASMHDTAKPISAKQPNSVRTLPEEMYAIARSLIPEEVALLGIGHVKALVNIALVSLSRSSPQTAWLLVGLASRTLQVMDQPLVDSNSTYKHVLHGCFLLDSLIALHLGQRPYLHVDEARRFGSIDEDGLDEWQPWLGALDTGQQPRAPTMALSSFNAILDLISLLSDNRKPTAEALTRLGLWESSLPVKLDFIHTLGISETLNPAAILLRMAYYCTRLVLTSSEQWLRRSLELFERAQTDIGWWNLPPVLPILFSVVQKRSTEMSLGRSVHDRLVQVQVALDAVWPKMKLGTSTVQASTATRPLSNEQSLPQLFSGSHAGTESFPLRPVSADMQPANPPTGYIDPILELASSNQTGFQYQQMPSDLEGFFDELASLDTANDVDNQPQFMQNLGFAPGANMADLFSEYTTAFMSNNDNDSVNLDHYGFYEGQLG
ncbi:hypothetical protein HBI56_108800 [Parastagonospora nodorum]|nr:hypothetical protein HBH51_047100 [Parastagonospora nodorum]KAH4004392.1 hypothetical protein HBI10_048180 [Parastagonospora nodorum]KAH4018612.1 hypothetical protein HBI13_134930 [Parastagonospora nodorum]KAH4102325.1 hypothetical protein HBH46_127840 [Parastagonospora nodorum]KAH4130225.1 hypothetical protein HBH47_021570 [Parastagonospora nodorum]